MNLGEYVGKNVKITLNTGQVFEGKACDYVQAVDNIPEIASISIGHTELYENEIKTIELA